MGKKPRYSLLGPAVLKYFMEANLPLYFKLNNMWKKIVIFSFLLLFFSYLGAVSAHNPRLVYNESLPLEKSWEVLEPENSQAFYGELKGQPDYYRFSFKNADDFYFALLSPDRPGARQDFSADLYALNADGDLGLVTSLLGGDEAWLKYFEKFAGDNYNKGPEKTVKIESGDYVIKVYNEDSLGQYSLVVGQKEAWPLSEIFKTLVAMPQLKGDFFGTSASSAYFNLFGVACFFSLLVIIFLLYLLRRFWKRLRS